jgi:hypothetical protein
LSTAFVTVFTVFCRHRFLSNPEPAPLAHAVSISRVLAFPVYVFIQQTPVE